MTEATAAAENEHEHAEGEEHHGDHPKWLQHHWDTPAQQFDAAKIGMWAFLGQELLFFSGLFVAYAIYRTWYGDAFAAGSHELSRPLGTINTCVLLFSSLTAALAVRSSQLGKKNETTVLILLTIACAFAFLCIKYMEYHVKFEHGLLPGSFFGTPRDILTFAPIPGATSEHAAALPPHTHAFFSLYFVMTGLHAIHVIIGIGVWIWILRRNLRGDFSRRYFTPVDVTALYWHLVDLVWIYLFPMLYLIDYVGPHKG
ncbi:MAG TPA: cytochrome c oxidase subunit 3 family protein [Polyangiaceae bacterium]|jgi:cytochrome c oxidase subunit 3